MQRKKINAGRLKKFAMHLMQDGQHFKCDTNPLQKESITHEDIDDGLIPIFPYPIFEMVNAFPGEWYYDKDYCAVWIHNPKEQDLIDSLIDFFQISHGMFQHLFCPGEQAPYIFAGRILEPNARPEDIACNIVAFIKTMQSQQSGFPININLN